MAGGVRPCPGKYVRRPLVLFEQQGTGGASHVRIRPSVRFAGCHSAAFNVYGPRQRPAYVVSRSVHRALHGLPPEIYDSGDQTRCFTYVDDAVRGTALAGKSPDADGECFNIGSDHETTVAEIVRTICSLSNLSVPAAALDTAAQFGASYQDIDRRVPDTSKARKVLGWECATPLQEGLSRTIDWARHNQWWLDLPAC